ncbi:hypothetical protein BsWGS_20657 [Bradybaena similaris]
MIIKLVRQVSSTSWGFRLQGGTDFSTPLSVQLVNSNSVAEKSGLRAGDAILAINNSTSDTMTHDEAKAEIVKSGNEISMLVEKGAVRIWRPKITPLRDLRPLELNIQKLGAEEETQPVQKTSLAFTTSPQEPCRIGSSHNRSPQPFSKSAFPDFSAATAQYNASNERTTADAIEGTAGFHGQRYGVGSSLSPTSPNISNSGVALEQDHDDGREGTLHGFRSVTAPATKPKSDLSQQSSMTCKGCNTLATGVIVTANDIPYHAACFKCTSCSVNLKQKGFFVVEGSLYCETHAKPSCHTTAA